MMNLSTKFYRPCPYLVNNNINHNLENDSLYFDEKTKTHYMSLRSPPQIDPNFLAQISHHEHTDIFSKVQSTKTIQNIDEPTSIMDMKFIKKYDKAINHKGVRFAVKPFSTKNRYSDIYPNDSIYRIQLSLPPSLTNNEYESYINASHIVPLDDISGLKHTYVSTQAPINTTLADFWQMAWESHVEVIMMLASCNEGGLNYRVHPYYPFRTHNTVPVYDKNDSYRHFDCDKTTINGTSEPNSVCIYGSILVEVLSCQQLSSHLIIREMRITNLDIKNESNTRIVRHIHFKTWPDYSVASNAYLFDLFHLYRQCRELMVNPHSPILAHCSAGIGRTGTFIAIDQMLDHIAHAQRTKEKIDGNIVPRIVTAMRACRPNMVQTDAQYRLIFTFIQWVMLHPNRYKLGLL